jgi:hypothetical protein
MIMKMEFIFNSAGAPAGRRAGAGPLQGHLSLADNLHMPEALDIVCPCCSATLKVDPETGSVIWVDQKKAPARDFDDLVKGVHSHQSALDEKFARSVQQTRNQRQILEKKFEEARKRAAADPNVRPPNPFDNE